MKRSLQGALALSVLVLTLLGCSLFGSVGRLVTAPTPTPLPPVVAPAPTAVGGSGGGEAVAALEGRLAQIYEQVNPSVVSIRVSKKVGASLQVPTIPGFPFQFPNPGDQYTYGEGSGFVWDTAGHIVTNNHVVDGAERVLVVFWDGVEVEAQIVGQDADSDLAVLKVDVPADRLRPVQLADSTQVRVGQLAIAIGNPFGESNSMTVGIISALDRSLPVQSSDPNGRYTIPDVIQTDAPINPGNSGGVLVDANGRVIGVTAAIESPVRANAGIGFVIPSVIVQKVVPALIEQGTYEHPWIGISGTSLGLDLNRAMDLPDDQQGVLVVDVLPDSPAERAGLRGSDREVTIQGSTQRVGGDVIIAVDGQPVRDFGDLVVYLARYTEVGQKITLTVLRNGRERQIDLTLAARPHRTGQTVAVSPHTGAWLGIYGQSMNADLADAMGLPADTQGVLVVQVQQNSPADKAGLRGGYKPVTVRGRQTLVGGDVIVAWDDQPVADMQHLKALLEQAEPGQQVTLTVLRDGEEVPIQVTLGEPTK